MVRVLHEGPGEPISVAANRYRDLRADARQLAKALRVLDVAVVRRLREFEAGNARRNKALVQPRLDIEIMNEVAEKW
ncbi:hypothetical protein [Lentisalinibacter orientalis]|uniref:hypothetical protein n=1 Tax=Lentisalinibacter orientalis TaxID=2992241 RepID=UPI00386E2195